MMRLTKHWAVIGRVATLIAIVFIFIFTLDSNHKEAVARDQSRLVVLATASVDTCNQTNERIIAPIRSLLKDSQKSSEASLKAFVKEGTLTEAQAKRSLESGQANTKSYLNRTMLIDCVNDRASRYYSKIADPAVRARVKADVTQSYIESQATIKAADKQTP